MMRVRSAGHDVVPVPGLVDFLAVCPAAGAVVGAIIALAFRADTNRELVNNLLAGAGLGGIAGSAIAFAIWIGGTLAGG